MNRKKLARHIGAHVSIAGGVQNAPGRAVEIGANALGIFTKNQRQWEAPPLTQDETTEFADELANAGIQPEQVLVHASYLINLANPDEQKRRKSVDALLNEAERVEKLGLIYLNFHPGSGLGEISEDESIERIATGVSEVIASTTTAVLVLENTAGQGNHVGYRFEHLAKIIDLAGNSNRIGVCIDSCHAFAAGYELRTDEGYDQTIRQLIDMIGMDRLAGIHLNDSTSEFESRRDRHAGIGDGEIGLPGLRRLVEDDRIPDVPFILETPDPSRWADEIQGLRQGPEG